MRFLIKFCLLLLLAVPLRAAEITLMWDIPAGSPAVTNFTMYASTASITNSATGTISIQVVNTNVGKFTGLNWQTKYYFVGTSREGTNESVFSNQVITNTVALPAPINLRIGP